MLTHWSYVFLAPTHRCKVYSSFTQNNSDARTKWPTFCRRHIFFCKEIFMSFKFDWNTHMYVPKGFIANEPSIVMVIACRTGDKPLPHPVITMLTDSYVCHQRPIYQQRTALIAAWINNHIHHEVLDEFFIHSQTSTQLKFRDRFIISSSILLVCDYLTMLGWKLINDSKGGPRLKCVGCFIKSIM